SFDSNGVAMAGGPKASLSQWESTSETELSIGEPGRKSDLLNSKLHSPLHRGSAALRSRRLRRRMPLTEDQNNKRQFYEDYRKSRNAKLPSDFFPMKCGA